ncbi:enoyl-CoA hydratase/isomerase family protein [Mycobacterium sp. LTG2003]
MLTNSSERTEPGGNVLVHQTGPCSVVTLNRPKVRNAMSSALLGDLAAALTRTIQAPATSAIVLTGAGGAFCSGDDLTEAASQPPSDFDCNIALLQRITELLLESPKPTIAAINGAAMGGGLELTLACDIRIAAEQAVFGCPEVHWGLVCTNGASRLLPDYIGRGRARDMLLTGQTYSAQWALAAGLISEVTTGSALDRAVALGGAMDAHREAIALTRNLLKDSSDEPMQTTLKREADAVSTARRTDVATERLSAYADRHTSKVVK